MSSDGEGIADSRESPLVGQAEGDGEEMEFERGTETPSNGELGIRDVHGRFDVLGRHGEAVLEPIISVLGQGFPHQLAVGDVYMSSGEGPMYVELAIYCRVDH